MTIVISCSAKQCILRSRNAGVLIFNSRCTVCNTSGFCHNVNEIFALLGHYAVLQCSLSLKLRYNLSSHLQLLSTQRYPYFDKVVGFAWSNGPESYAGGSVATGRASPMPDRSKVVIQTKWDTLVLQVGGWVCGSQLHPIKICLLRTF